MRGRSLFLIAAALAPACGNTTFDGDDSDSGSVGANDGGTNDGGSVTDGTTSGSAVPASVTFVDQDPSSGEVLGNVKVARAPDESNVTHYVLYWSKDGTAKLGAAIATIVKTGGDLTYTFGSGATAPVDANFILAFTGNDSAENPGFAAGAGDNYAHSNDMSGVTVMATSVPVVVDAADRKMGTLALGGIVSCPMPFGACTQKPTVFSNTYGAVFDASFDARQKKVLGLGVTTTNGAHLLACNMDGTGCSDPAVNAAFPTTTGSLLVDDVSDKVFLFGSAGSTVTVAVCAHDGTGCSLHAISANGGPTGNYGAGRMALDTTGNRLEIAVTDFTSGMKQLGLLVCNAAFGATDECTLQQVSADADSGHNPSIALDTKNGKVLVVTDYETGGTGALSLYVCELNGSSCKGRVDLSASASTGPGVNQLPSAVYDPDGAHLYVGASNANSNTPTLYRCNVDGTGCTTTALAKVGAGGAPTLRYDTTTKRIYFGFASATNAVLGSIATW